ncbi:MAG TPA: hypothetical protein P5560_10960, partial [Thermotogota bacterium]|nr:hypothetical protein [Thermotogota bacterium]
AALSDNTIQTFDAEGNAQELFTVPTENGSVQSIDILEVEGTYYALITTIKTDESSWVGVYDLNTGECQGQFEAHADAGQASREGEVAFRAVAGSDGKIYVTHEGFAGVQVWQVDTE